MSVLKVVNYGDPVLRTPAEEVKKVSAKIQKLISDMFDTMYAQNGVGLAAPQVGISKRVFVLDCSTEEEPAPQLAMINPKIVKKSGACVSYEGCLSFPEVFTDVKRYSDIVVRFTDAKGRKRQLEVVGGSLMCRAIQHEMDHLDGIVFVDHVIDSFGANELLAKHNLPSIEREKMISEPDLDEALALKV